MSDLEKIQISSIDFAIFNAYLALCARQSI